MKQVTGGFHLMGIMKAFNESVLKIISLVSKKTGISDHNQILQSYQQGGTYIKLENEWRESLKQRNNNVRIIKAK